MSPRMELPSQLWQMKKKRNQQKQQEKEITCFKCKKKGHYSNKCTEELPTATDKKGTSLLINKEDSFDEEIEDGQYEMEEENVSTISEEQELDNQEKYSTAQEDSKESDDWLYEEDSMFSNDDYEGFAFVQDVTCNMNDKARIPDSWILLDSQSTVDVFKNKKLLKNIRDAKRLCHYIAMLV